jgi:hypothetical protein
MSVIGLLDGSSSLVVGIQDEPGGGLRVYLGHRSDGVYCIIEDRAAIERLRCVWSGNCQVVIATPPADCIYREGPSAP